MSPSSILFPMFGLVFLTLCVLLQIPFARFRAAAARKVTIGDFRLGESPRVPPETQLPNRNYMNLLELPMLFYVACLSMFVTQRVDAVGVSIAWAYVVLRVIHSVIHLTYNNVIHRLVAFATSSTVLSVLWVRFFVTML
jgi:hypothetical protein